MSFFIIFLVIYVRYGDIIANIIIVVVVVVIVFIIVIIRFNSSHCDACICS